ncbi:CaiB/BaiF CoA transferase family protein [Nonomuraea purpurea]|uniref:CaiB/BaiF CoA transferase family protein n=1 Tax=Nonomuraea purpurea TaxID=1849276 RepID=A0ABV8G189_9ACTN
MGSQGPLLGVKVLELAGMGPAPYGCMLLADLGADVVRVDRHDARMPPEQAARDVVSRGRRSIGVDMKSPEGAEVVLRLAERADVLVDPYRPGVAERLGLGPQACAKRNPRLVYARMTGFGQSGPLAANAGHDINYIALGGALAHIGRAGEPPVPPLNLVGDMGGGMLLAYGVACALFEARGSGRGQEIDVAMIDGVASLMSMMYGFAAQGIVTEERGANVFDTGSHFYEVYECADGEYVSVGAIEPGFYRKLVTAIGLDPDSLPRRGDRRSWPESKRTLAAVFRTRTRAQWSALLEPHPDLCFAPVLSMSQAPSHPHHRERGTFIEVEGVTQPAPAPRFSRTPGAVARPPAAPGRHADEVLTDWLDVDAQELRDLRERGALG